MGPIETPEMSGSLAYPEFDTTSSIEGLQTDEQRRVLDIVAQLRKCGLESVLSLPQLVVCGDQSAGKSSVLEALTEIPFPRNDNLCTRFPTEIILRRAPTDSLAIRVIPDHERPAAEQATIKAFRATITDFEELPEVMDQAMSVMGIKNDETSMSSGRAFSKDVLSIEIEGPTRPQLTLVDLPGIIQTETKGVTKSDVELVAEITDRYISQSRTICLAVISATNDYANQGILTKVRQVDPKGERTLGIITKPDRLPPNSGSEGAFLGLARNEDIFFHLGWHVLKNRAFDETSNSFLERNASEATFFRKSNFSSLSPECRGIDALRHRLSQLLFDHVKQELPKLREDLHGAMMDARSQLQTMGSRRATAEDCKAYLSQLSLDYYEACKAAVGGNYEGNYFTQDTYNSVSSEPPVTIRRLRAAIQYMNTKFSENLRLNGHRYHIDRPKGPQDPVMDDADLSDDGNIPSESLSHPPVKSPDCPVRMSLQQSQVWVSQVLVRTRGRELPGNFNPLLIGELFWEQSSNWENFATDHVEQVASVCGRFLDDLLEDKCPKDIRPRLSPLIHDSLKIRNKAALEELKLIMEDLKSYPINYNHYYTDTIKKQRKARDVESLAKSIESSTQHTQLDGCQANHTSASVNVTQAIDRYSKQTDPDMEKHTCEEALDCLFSIYKVSQKTFVANVTTQVIERHIVKGLEKIFSPVVVNGLSVSDAEAIAMEPVTAKRQRDFLEDRIGKLEDGHKILRDVIKTAT